MVNIIRVCVVTLTVTRRCHSEDYYIGRLLQRLLNIRGILLHTSDNPLDHVHKLHIRKLTVIRSTFWHMHLYLACLGIRVIISCYKTTEYNRLQRTVVPL